MADFDDFDVDDYNFDEIKEPSPKPNKRKQDEAGLGIDEEVSVAKRARAPAVKLDERRLLSDQGIPRLRQQARNLKLKGKGHEFSDAARLLDFYQDWLDDLFPKAKFLDALAMVEKLGHKNVVRRHRMDWISEGKPKDVDDLDDGAPPPPPNADADAQPAAATQAPVFGGRRKDGRNGPKTPDGQDGGLFGDDAAVLDLTPRVERTTLEEGPTVPMMSGALPGGGGGVPGSIFGSGPTTEGSAQAPPPAPSAAADKNGGPGASDAGLGDDDLDALMAEAEAESMAMMTTTRKKSQQAASPPKPPENDFADDEAAMAEMDGLW